VESMLSHAGTQLGQGWVFGLAEALDQGGATIGPLIVALVLHVNGGYHRAFAVLLAPALLCLGSIVTARVLFPRPEEFEKESGARSQESEEKVRDRPLPLASTPFSKAFWLYCIAGALVAAGFADFALIAFHFQKTGTVSQGTIPVLYALAMVMGALAPLLMGRLLDKLGPRVLMVALVLPSLFAPFAFAAGASMAIIGVLLWGIGLGIQDSQLKAALVRVIAREKRSTAFGLFDSIFGVGWFLGSAAMGLLYGHSVHAVVVFSVGLQLAALPVLYVAQRRT